jgi:hypothetical protein
LGVDETVGVSNFLHKKKEKKRKKEEEEEEEEVDIITKTRQIEGK